MTDYPSPLLSPSVKAMILNRLRLMDRARSFGADYDEGLYAYYTAVVADAEADA